MSDPVFLIAITGLSLSGIVSALRLIDWFLHTDAKALAQIWRLAAVGLFALALPLLFGLSVNQKWTEAIALSAIMLLAFALYGPRVLAQIFPRGLAPDLSGRAAGYCGPDVATPEAETVQRAIAVLEEYLRRTANASALQRSASAVSIARPCTRANGNGHERDGHDAQWISADVGSGGFAGPRPLRGRDGIGDQRIHRRLMQLIHPDRGGLGLFRREGQSGQGRSARPRPVIARSRCQCRDAKAPARGKPAGFFAIETDNGGVAQCLAGRSKAYRQRPIRPAANRIGRRAKPRRACFGATDRSLSAAQIGSRARRPSGFQGLSEPEGAGRNLPPRTNPRRRRNSTAATFSRSSPGRPSPARPPLRVMPG